VDAIQTQCRCGSIGLKISGQPAVQIFCHCDDCQKAHGAAYVPAMIYPAPAVEVVKGEPSPMVIRATKRMRCPSCGTYLFAELEGVGMRSVSAYLLPTESFRPQFHVQCQHAVRPVVDHLPHFKGFPAAFGGKDEFVAW
jgi:hypothetical protein